MARYSDQPTISCGLLSLKLLRVSILVSQRYPSLTLNLNHTWLSRQYDAALTKLQTLFRIKITKYTKLIFAIS
jgi:hypothetical protein